MGVSHSRYHLAALRGVVQLLGGLVEHVGSTTGDVHPRPVLRESFGESYTRGVSAVSGPWTHVLHGAALLRRPAALHTFANPRAAPGDHHDLSRDGEDRVEGEVVGGHGVSWTMCTIRVSGSSRLMFSEEDGVLVQSQ